MIDRRACGVGRGLFDLPQRNIDMLVLPFRISVIDHQKLVDNYTDISIPLYNVFNLDKHLSVVCSRERAAVALQFNDALWCFSCHVMYCILVTQPVGALDSVIHVPSPIVFVHTRQEPYQCDFCQHVTIVSASLLSERSVNTTLCSHCVTSCREEFGYACCIEASLRQAEGSSKTRSAGANHECIIFMIL